MVSNPFIPPQCRQLRTWPTLSGPPSGSPTPSSTSPCAPASRPVPSFCSVVSIQIYVIEGGDHIQLSKFLVLGLSELVQVHLIGTVRNPQCPLVGPHPRQREVLAHTTSTMGLDRTVNDFAAHLGDIDLGHRNVLQSALGVRLINLDGGIEDQQTASINLDARLCNPLDDSAVLRESLAEGHACRVVGTENEELKGNLRNTDGAHAVVDTSGSETALDDLETTALAEEKVLGRDTDVAEVDFAVTVRCVVKAIDIEGAKNSDTRGVGRNQDHGLLLVRAWVFGIGLAHDEVDLAAWVTSTRRPPFCAVEDVVIAVTDHTEVDVGGIGRGGVALSHQEGGAALTVEERSEPLLLLCVVTILGNGLHVASVRSGAVHGLGGNVGAAHKLGHESIFEVGERDTLAVVDVGKEKVPETELLCPGLKRIDHSGVVVEETLGVVLGHLGLEDSLGRHTLILNEVGNLREGEQISEM